MMDPDFERAIVVTFSEVKTLRTLIEHERGLLQQARNEDRNIADTCSRMLLDIAHVEKRLEEVQRHMETDEAIWNERMRGYEKEYENREEEKWLKK